MYIYSGNNIRKHIHPLPDSSSSSSIFFVLGVLSFGSDLCQTVLQKTSLPRQRAIFSAQHSPLAANSSQPAAPNRKHIQSMAKHAKTTPFIRTARYLPASSNFTHNIPIPKKPPIICGPTKKETRFVQPVPFPTGLIRYLLQQPMRSVRCFCFCFPVGPFFPRKPRNAARIKGNDASFNGWGCMHASISAVSR